MMMKPLYTLFSLLVCSGVAAAADTNATKSDAKEEAASGSGNEYKKITDSNIHHAVREWVHRRSDAILEFGHIKDWDVSEVTDMSQLFSSDRLNPAAQFNDDISSWDTPKLKNISYMFYGNEVMDIDFSHWTFKHVEDASYAFAETKKYSGWGLAYLETDKLLNAKGMFQNAVKFDANGVHQWSLSKLKDGSFMFKGAKSFQGDHKFQWTTYHLKTTEEMFAECDSFVGDLSKLNTTSVTSMKGMFFKAPKWDGDVSSWNTASVGDMNSVFAYAESFTGQGISEWDTSKTTIMSNMLKRTPKFNQDVNGWDVSKVTDMRNLFRYSSSMDQSVCWDLHNNANVNGIFFQSKAHFDSKCVTTNSFIKDSCCDPSIDKKCGCSEATTNEDHVTQQQVKKSNSDSEKSRHSAAIAIITIATFCFLMFFAYRRWKKNGIETTSIPDYGMDDPDLKMNVTMDMESSSPTKPYNDSQPYRDNTEELDEEDGDMEEINVREII